MRTGLNKGDFVGRGFVVVEIRADGPESRVFDAAFLQEIADVVARAGMAVLCGS